MSLHPTALITGITGQDGAYLAELLLDKGYSVHGLQRRASLPNTSRIEHLLERGLQLHGGDLTDAGSLLQLVQQLRPHEVYNLGAQSHVAVSFDEPEYTAEVDALGTLRLLEAVRLSGLGASARFYQASTSELFGLVQQTPQTETTPFHPRSPYGVAKLYAYWITVNYRESYGMYACNGILFNHESPWRGETFVTRKITLALARIACGIQQRLRLGNLEARRDWGHARDYVEMAWLMLQQAHADDYVVASGEQHTVREFVELAAAELGMELEWRGSGATESGWDRVSGRCVVEVDAQCFRPAEVETLLGNADKATRVLGWKPRTRFRELVREMARSDLERVRRSSTAGQGPSA